MCRKSIDIFVVCIFFLDQILPFFSSVIKMLFMETTSNIILSNGKLESFPLSKINSFQFSRLVVSDSWRCHGPTLWQECKMVQQLHCGRELSSSSRNYLQISHIPITPSTTLFLSVQSSRSVVSDSAIPCTSACQGFLSITNSQTLPKLMSTESVMPSKHLLLYRPLLLLPSIFPSIRVFSNESALSIRWSKYWSFSFNISPSNEHTQD